MWIQQIYYVPIWHPCKVSSPDKSGWTQILRFWRPFLSPDSKTEVLYKFSENDWCQQDSNLQHACLSYVTAFKDRKLFQLSYDIMYDGFSHCRVFPCLVIINTTIKPLLSMSLLPFYRRAVGCCLMTGRLSEFHWINIVLLLIYWWWPGQDSNLRLQT